MMYDEQTSKQYRTPKTSIYLCIKWIENDYGKL